MRDEGWGEEGGGRAGKGLAEAKEGAMLLKEAAMGAAAPRAMVEM